MSFADKDHKREACFELTEKLFNRFKNSGVKPFEKDESKTLSEAMRDALILHRKQYLAVQASRPKPTMEDIQEILSEFGGCLLSDEDISFVLAVSENMLIGKISIYMFSNFFPEKLLSDSEIYEQALNSYKTAKEKEDENVAKFVFDVYEFLLRHFFKIIPAVASTIMLVCAICLDKYDVFEGFYTVLRLVVCATSVFYVVKFRQEFFRWIFGVLAVLYNPVFQIHLGDKDVWNVVNIITIIFMWIAIFFEGMDKLEEETRKKESN